MSGCDIILPLNDEKTFYLIIPRPELQSTRNCMRLHEKGFILRGMDSDLGAVCTVFDLPNPRIYLLIISDCSLVFQSCFNLYGFQHLCGWAPDPAQALASIVIR